MIKKLKIKILLHLEIFNNVIFRYFNNYRYICGYF